MSFRIFYMFENVNLNFKDFLINQKYLLLKNVCFSKENDAMKVRS